MAGYSKRALIDKLGIKPSMTILILNAPDHYGETLGPLPEGVTVQKRLSGTCDLIQFFTKSRAEFLHKLPELRAHLAQNGMLWISWPKGASKVPTDMNENFVRDTALAHQLVDVKVVAVDEIWSGLKLVIPVALRRGA